MPCILPHTPTVVLTAAAISYIPCACYALYNVFFADFDDLLGPVTWVSFGQTVFLVGFISVSAAKVSAEVRPLLQAAAGGD